MPGRFNPCAWGQALTWVSRIATLLLLSTNHALAGQESAWNILKQVQSSKDELRLVFEPHRDEILKACSRLAIDIEEYDSFKWRFVAAITGSLKPEKKESIESLLAKLNGLVGKEVYVVERTPLRRISDCHFSADGAVLENDRLSLYFKLYRR